MVLLARSHDIHLNLISFEQDGAPERFGNSIYHSRPLMDGVSPLAHSVFVNCPFDEAYKPLFDSLVFTVHDCGIFVRCALETTDSGEIPFQKICQLIREPADTHHFIWAFFASLGDSIIWAKSAVGFQTQTMGLRRRQSIPATPGFTETGKWSTYLPRQNVIPASALLG
jgi:hypothetical protein